MQYFVIALLIAVVIILSVQLKKKRELDTEKVEKYNEDIEKLSSQCAQKKAQLDSLSSQVASAERNLEATQYKFSKMSVDLDAYFNIQKKTRQQQLDSDFSRQLEDKQLLVINAEKVSEQKIEEIQNATQAKIASCQEEAQLIIDETQLLQERYEALIEPLKKYEMEQQQRLFYTIQVPDEYREDIDYLVTNVSQKIQHPDIINKLVWNEYVKPYIEDTFRRVGIEDKPGIYKITNIDSGKSYIGKSTNMKKRLADHFKSSIGIKTIADQAVHHEIWKTGFWNWMIEAIIYADKDKLNELEKYYIDFFDTVNNGYNRNAGGGG